MGRNGTGAAREPGREMELDSGWSREEMSDEEKILSSCLLELRDVGRPLRTPVVTEFWRISS